MDKEKIETKLKTMFSKGAQASKDAFSKAGNAVQNFSDKTVQKIETQQLKSKRAKKYEELGELVSTLILQNYFSAENVTQLSSNSPEIEKITEIQNQITQLTTEIENNQ